MGIGPYQARPYDNSRGMSRMADLALHRGEIEAEGALRSGQAWASGVQQVGQIAGRTMADLAEYQDQKPIRDAERQRANESLQNSRRKGEFNEALKEAGTRPPDEAIEFLRTRGFAPEASEMAKELAETRKRAIDTSVANLALTKGTLDQALTLLGSVREAPDPGAAYAQSLPKIQEMVGADLAQNLPKTYDPASLDRVMAWGMSTTATLDNNAKLLAQTRTTFKDAADREDHFTKSLSQYLPTVTTAADWTAGLRSAEEAGAPKIALDKFAATYSPEAAARAAQLTQPRRADAPLGSAADIIAGEQTRLGRDLNTDEKLALVRRQGTADRAPSTAGAGGLTQVQINAATGRRDTAIAALNRERRDADATLTDDMYGDELHRIEASYAQQIGQPPPPPRLGVQRGEPGAQSSAEMSFEEQQNQDSTSMADLATAQPLRAAGGGAPRRLPGFPQSDPSNAAAPPPARPSAPLGAAPATAARPPAPRAQAAPPSASGQITVQTLPDGKFAVKLNGQRIIAKSKAELDKFLKASGYEMSK